LQPRKPRGLCGPDAFTAIFRRLRGDLAPPPLRIAGADQPPRGTR
jgi:hypothetical protein